jgi:hypothetical protein
MRHNRLYITLSIRHVQFFPSGYFINPEVSHRANLNGSFLNERHHFILCIICTCQYGMDKIHAVARMAWFGVRTDFQEVKRKKKIVCFHPFVSEIQKLRNGKLHRREFKLNMLSCLGDCVSGFLPDI